MKKLVYVINVDWYFALHWLERAKASVKKGYDVTVIMQCSDPEAVQKVEKTGAKVIDVNISRKGINPFSEIATIFVSVFIIFLSNCLAAIPYNHLLFYS